MQTKPDKAARQLAFWTNVLPEINTGARRLFLDSAGHICLSEEPTGFSRILPQFAIDQLAPEIVAALDIPGHAARQAEKERAKAEAGQAALADYNARLQATRDAGHRCILLAGENTAIVTAGTLDECLDAIPLVRSQPRDRQSGIGLYVIVNTVTCERLLQGEYDKSCTY